MNEKQIIISEMIKKYMQLNNFTMKELGEKLGKSEATVSYWIKGRNNPKIGDIQKMADMFGLTTEQMLYGDDIETEEIPEIKVINRAMKKMSPAQKEKMMQILKLSFEEEFDDD